jgi:hypothetical protein
VTGGNSYPRPRSVVSTWDLNGGYDVLSWIVDAVGGERLSEQVFKTVLTRSLHTLTITLVILSLTHCTHTLLY